MIITPSPKQGPLTISIGWEGAQGRRQRGRTVRGPGAGWEGKSKGPIVSGSCGHTSVIRKRMGKASAVQTGRALPMCRCASPACLELSTGRDWFPYVRYIFYFCINMNR